MAQSVLSEGHRDARCAFTKEKNSTYGAVQTFIDISRYSVDLPVTGAPLYASIRVTLIRAEELIPGSIWWVGLDICTRRRQNLRRYG